MSPFASKVLEELRRSPETPLSFFTMRDLAAVEKFVGGPRESLEDMPPSHRYWLVLSGLAVKSTETTARFTTLRKLGKGAAEAHDKYTPGEKTPVLESTWMTWWLLDLPCGPARETYVSVLAEIAPALGAPPWLTSALRTLAESRLGVYRVTAIAPDRVHLTELITERTFDVVLEDESDWRAPLWLARVLPPPDGSSGACALVDKPYDLRAGEAEWLAYFERILSGVPDAERHAALARHCKALDDSHRWLEFIARAYAGQDPVTHVNVLAGVPDRLEKQPAPFTGPLPQLLNTSGEAVLLSTALFHVRDIRAARRALEKWLGEPQGGSRWELREGDTVQASLELHGDDLRVECNTRQRLDAAKPLVKQRLGQAVKHRFDKHEDPNAEPAEERSAKSREPKVAPPPPEVAQMLQEHMLSQVRAGLDEPNPILDGKTAREAVKTERGRKAVRQLLVRQQKLFEQGGMHWLDLSEILEELGLVKKEPEYTKLVRKLLLGEKLSGPETDVILKRVSDELERRGQTPRSGTDVVRMPREQPPETPERLKARKERRWLNRILSSGKLSGAVIDDILQDVLPALEREGYVPPTILEVSCTPGTLSACPASSKLVFSASGFRAGGFISAYAQPLDHDAEPIFYYSDEDGCPELAQPAEGSRTEHTVPLSPLHRRGRYRLHAFLADSAIGRDEMLEGADDIYGIAARQQVEIVIVD